jgi:hypothetical protein
VSRSKSEELVDGFRLDRRLGPASIENGNRLIVADDGDVDRRFE